MNFEKQEKKIDVTRLIKDTFASEEELKKRILEISKNGKGLVMYTPDFARAVFKDKELPKDFPVLKLMIAIKKVFPSEEDLEKEKFLGKPVTGLQNKKRLDYLFLKKQIESSKKLQQREARRGGFESGKELEDFLKNN